MHPVRLFCWHFMAYPHLPADFDSKYWASSGQGRIPLFTKTGQIAPDGTLLASGSLDDTIILWAAQTGNLLHVLEDHTRDVQDVSWSPEALHKLMQFDKHPDMRDFGVCMVKTHLSLSHNPEFKGCPTGWTLPILDVLVYNGARFIVPVAGDIKLLPGTGSNPAFRRIDVDTETGKVTGLF